MEKRIYFYDTDAGGVVYYGHYLQYLEEARTEFLETRGLSVAEFHNQGFLYAVRSVKINYRSPARYGDILNCDARLEKCTAVQLFFEQTISQKETGKIVADAQVVLVCLDSQFKPVALPEGLRRQLEA